MASSVIIGRVAVKVLPDTGDFRKDAQRKLDAIEKRIEVKLPTLADMTGAERSLLEGIRDLNARNRAQDSRKVKLFTVLDLKGIRESLNKAVRRYEELSRTNTVKLKSELTGADLHLQLDDDNLRKVKDEIDHWVRQHSPIKIPVKLDIAGPSAILAGLRLDRIARPRTVNLIPKVDSKAAAVAGTVIAALSGGRAVSKFFSEFTDWFKNLDKAIPKLAAMALAITALGGYGLTAAANLAALSASLASIAPVALGLPGLLGGIAVGLTVTIVALKDAKKYVPEVAAAWGKLKTTISENFWAKAAAPIRSMIDGLLPEFVSGFSKASTQIGGYFGGLATALNGKLKPALKGMFGDLSASVRIATKGTPAIASLVANLGTVGAHLLPRLASWFVKVTDKFSAFIDKATKDGRLQQWIDNGITALHQLGQVLSNIGGIFMGIGKAASAAGGSSLGLMADTLEHVNKVVNSPGFQTGLVRTFAAAFQMMHNIASVAGPPLTALFETLSRTFTTVLPTAGKAIGTLLGSVAKLLGGVGIQNGLIKAFDGINQAVQALAPAIQDLEPVIAQLLQFIGAFAAQLGPLFASVISSLAPVLTAILKAAEPLMKVLTGVLTSLFKALGPTIKQLTPVIAKLGGAVVQMVTPIAKALVPILKAVMPIIVQIVKILDGSLAQILPVIGKSIADLMPALTPVLVALGKLLITILKPLMPAIVQIAQQALPPMTKALIQLMPSLVQLITAFTSILKLIMPILVPALTFMAQVITTQVTTAITIITGIVGGFAGALQKLADFISAVFNVDWQKVWTSVKDFFTDMWNKIKAVIDKVWGDILGALTAGWTAIKGWFQSGAKTLAGVWSALWDGLKDAPGKLFSWLLSTATSGFTKLATFASDAIGKIVSFFASLPTKIGDLAGDMLQSGKDLINALFNGLSEIGSGVADIGKAIVNSVIDGLNGMLPHHLDINMPFGVPDIHVPLIPEIHHLAKGATVLPQDGGTLAILAEAGKAETVVDTGKVNKLIEKALRKDDGGGSSNSNSKTFIYNAAPGHSLSSQEDLFAATERARFAW